MSAIYLLIGGLVGCLLYRLGRREGEVGRVLPIGRRKTPKEASILDKIERYNGEVRK